MAARGRDQPAARALEVAGGCPARRAHRALARRRAGRRSRSTSSSTDPRNPVSAASGSRPGCGSATAAVARPTTSCSDWSTRRARPTARTAPPRSSWSPTTATCATPCSSRAPGPRGPRGSSVASTGRRHDPPGPVLPRRRAHPAPMTATMTTARAGNPVAAPPSRRATRGRHPGPTAAEPPSLLGFARDDHRRPRRHLDQDPRCHGAVHHPRLERDHRACCRC